MMAYSLRWYQPNRIILIVGSGEITIEDVRDVSRELTEWLDKASARSYLIADISAVTAYPGIALDAFRASTYLQHPRMRGVVMVGVQSELLQVIINLINSLSPAQFKAVSSLEAALALIESWDVRGQA